MTGRKGGGPLLASLIFRSSFNYGALPAPIEGPCLNLGPRSIFFPFDLEYQKVRLKLFLIINICVEFIKGSRFCNGDFQAQLL